MLFRHRRYTRNTMSPNAIHDQQSAQIAQLKAMKDGADANADLFNKVIDELEKGVGALDSMGTIPSILDVGKLAKALRSMAVAQLIAARTNMNNSVKQSKELEDVLKQAESKIVKATLIG